MFQFHCSLILWAYISRLGLPKYGTKVLVYNLVYTPNVQAHKHKGGVLHNQSTPPYIYNCEILFGLFLFSKNEYHKPSLVLSE